MRRNQLQLAGALRPVRSISQVTPQVCILASLNSACHINPYNDAVHVGSQDFELFTEGDAAWMADPSQSANAVQAIRAGSTMSVTGTSADGQSIRQTFSLSGATAAGRSMDGAC